MQQVFVTVKFLMKKIAVYERILRLVTYDCIPLSSPDSGELEWVENTIAFGACVAGTS